MACGVWLKLYRQPLHPLCRPLLSVAYLYGITQDPALRIGSTNTGETVIMQITKPGLLNMFT